jgi:hypothetical protein
MVDILRQPLRAYVPARPSPLPDKITEIAAEAAAPAGIDRPVTGEIDRSGLVHIDQVVIQERQDIEILDERTVLVDAYPPSLLIGQPFYFLQSFLIGTVFKMVQKFAQGFFGFVSDDNVDMRDFLQDQVVEGRGVIPYEDDTDTFKCFFRKLAEFEATLRIGRIAGKDNRLRPVLFEAFQEASGGGRMVLVHSDTEPLFI